MSTVNTPDKKALLSLVLAQIASELLVLQVATKAALAAATDEESKPENQYDTRALEASYLAAAQGKRVSELQRMVSVLENFPLPVASSAVQSGTLVQMESEERKAWYFLLPFGAGVTAESSGHKVSVVTLDSPLGQVIVGKRAGDTAELQRAGNPKEFEILQIL